MYVFKDSGIYKGPGIYKTGAASGGGGVVIPLPDGYEQLDKLLLNVPSQGVGIPLTGIRASYANTSTSFILEAKMNEVFDSGNRIFNSTPVTPLYGIYYNGYYMGLNGGGGSVNLFVGMVEQLRNILTNRFILKSNRVKTILNELEEEHNYFSEISRDSFWIMNHNQYGSQTNMDVYSFQLEAIDGTKIFIGVPAKRLLDEKEGLFDLITNEFFPTRI